MAKHAKRGFWPVFRVWFRRFRISVLLGILAALCALVYLNKVGLPGFIKRPLLDRLEARGVHLEFSRLRLRFYRGIVAENVSFGRAGAWAGAGLSARETEVKLNWRALSRVRIEVDAIRLRGGLFVLPAPGTNQPTRALRLENIEANLRFAPGDRWMMDYLQANFAGARLTLTGAITNASAVRDWNFPRANQLSRQRGVLLGRVADALDNIHFAAQPELQLEVTGDARDLRSFSSRLTLHASDADTPWARIKGAAVTAQLLPAHGNEQRQHAEVTVEAQEAQTPWGSLGGLKLAGKAVPRAGQTNLVDCDLTLRAAQAETRWAAATNAQLTARWICSLTNAIPVSGQAELRSAQAASRWAAAQDVHFKASLGPSPNPPLADEALGLWRKLEPYALDWSCGAAHVQLESLETSDFSCAGQWRGPRLEITNLHAKFQDGPMDGHAELDALTRVARFEVASAFDAHKIGPLLTDKTRRWMDKFTWEDPPRLAGGGSLVLPPWTSSWSNQADWRGAVRPTIQLWGDFTVTNGAYLGLPASWARSHVSYSNLVWRLPDLEIGRPEGELHLVHMSDDRTQDYYWRINGTLDPRALRPVLPSNAQHGLDLFTFNASPNIDAEVWGRYYEHDRLGVAGRVSLTNFAFRGQTADYFESSLRFTNLVLDFLDPRLTRGTQFLSAAAVEVDIGAERVSFTNGLGATEPMAVGRAIGPRTAKAIEPFRFIAPPTVHVNGWIPFRSEGGEADLRFEIQGGPFEWWRFKTPRISGNLQWLNQSLLLTNVQADFYGGQAGGWAFFDFSPDEGTDLAFNASVTNALLQLAMADISTRSNHLEGLLSGQFTLAAGNSRNKKSWNGHGHVQLHDGLIWEIPIFGVLSKPLDVLMPGVGNSRLGEGSARFVITNGVVFSDSLEMRSPMLQLRYHGSVDYDARVDARVEVEPLGHAWLVGPLFRLALWPVSKLFEYRITGTLQQPVSRPLYIPKPLLWPLSPLGTLGGFVNGALNFRTNAPAAPEESLFQP